MPFAVCRKSDNVIRAASRWDRPVVDEATEVLLELSDMPDRVTQRWDGAKGLRDATAQELSDAAEAEKVAKGQSTFDGDLLLMALARWTAQKVGVSAATARSEILAIYRNLLN